MREGMTSEAAKNSLARVLLAEQKLVYHASPEALLNLQPVFLEQTFVGGDIGNLLHCVKALGSATALRDIVAFRVVHQIANVLQGSYLHDEAVGSNKKLVDLLMESSNDRTGSFDQWDACRNGTEIEVMKQLETNELEDEENESARKTITPENYTRENDDGPWEHVFNLIFRVMGGGFLQSSALNDLRQDKESIKKKLEGLRNNKETVFLIRTGREETKGRGGKTVEAMICGGKIRKQTEKILGGEASFPTSSGEFGELYYLFVHPDLSNNAKYVDELLSEFSHQMYLREYSKCITLVHEEEAGMLSSDYVQKGDKMHSRFSRAKLGEIIREELSGHEKLQTDDFHLPHQKEIVRNCLRMWGLNTNIWQENISHMDFLELKGIEILTQFATKSQANEIPSSPTRDLLKSQSFGTELMLLLNDSGPGMNGHRLPQKDISLNDVLRRTFINPLMDGDMSNDIEYSDALKMILTDRNDTGTPAWNKFLVYSKEENALSIQTMNPFPEPYAVKHQSIFRPNPHAVEDYLFHRGPMNFYKPWGYDAIETSTISADIVKLIPNVSSYRTQIQSIVSQKQHEASEQEKRDAILAEKQSEKEDHLHAVTAALIRAFYVLITKSSTRIREKTQTKLRVSKIMYPIIKTMKSIDYGIDRSVYKRSKYNFGAAMKFLVLAQELTDINARGHKACLEAIEFYEILSQMVLDVMDKMKRLIASRDFDIKNYSPDVSRRLSWYDEQMLCESTATVVELVREIASLNFFEGKKRAILSGNEHCRKAAIKNMFTKHPNLLDVIVSFLQYDTEVSVTGISPGENEDLAKYIYKEQPKYRREHLDQMRINCVTVLAELLNFDDKFKHRFFRDYTTGSVKAVVGLRQSFMLDVLKQAGWSRLRIELQGIKVTNHEFKGSGEEAEVIEALAVVNLDGAFRCLVLTGERYFLSRNSIPPRLRSVTDAQLDNFSSGDWAYFTDLEARSYSDIRGISSAYGDQMFATIGAKNRVEIFHSMQLGVVDRLVNVFARYCRDDLDEPLLDRPSTGFVQETKKHSNGDTGTNEDEERRFDFFAAAQEALFARLAKSNSRMRNPQIVCHTAANFGLASQSSFSPKVLIWISCQQEQYLVVCNTMPTWKPSLPPTDGNPEDFYRCDGTILDFKNIYSFEFSDSLEPRVALRYKSQSKYETEYAIQFACDASREIWRREVRKYIKADKGSSRWSSAAAPVVQDVEEKVVRKFI